MTAMSFMKRNLYFILKIAETLTRYVTSPLFTDSTRGNVFIFSFHEKYATFYTFSSLIVLNLVILKLVHCDEQLKK